MHTCHCHSIVTLSISEGKVVFQARRRFFFSRGGSAGHACLTSVNPKRYYEEQTTKTCTNISAHVISLFEPRCTHILLEVGGESSQEGGPFGFAFSCVSASGLYVRWKCSSIFLRNLSSHFPFGPEGSSPFSWRSHRPTFYPASAGLFGIRFNRSCIPCFSVPMFLCL